MALVTLRLFASARVAAGVGRDQIQADTVGDALDEAMARYGPDFSEVLAGCRIWRNGEHTERGESLAEGDELAVLPPVSGGS
ncbi:MAG: MoaD/ThiS family protein [Acidimicrobiales bacterium]